MAESAVFDDLTGEAPPAFDDLTGETPPAFDDLTGESDSPPKREMRDSYSEALPKVQVRQKKLPPPMPDVVAKSDPKKERWEWAKQHYETGVKSTSAIAKEIGVAVQTVKNRAVTEGWERSTAKSLEIEQRRRALQAKEYADARAQEQAALTARSKAAASNYRAVAVRKESVTALINAQEEVYRVTAIMQSNALTDHRSDIRQARAIALTLLEELAAVSSNLEVFENLGEALRGGQDADKLDKAYKRVLSLTERSATLGNLSNVLRNLIVLERQALGITGAVEDPEKPRAPDEVTRGLDEIMAKFDAVLQMQIPPGTERKAHTIDVSTREVVTDVS